MYIQDIEETYESTLKGKYFIITTKKDYRKALTEAKDMIKNIYPDRTNKVFNMSSQINNTPIIHTNVSTYTQALMSFHESNPVQSQSSHKRLKIQFNFKAILDKRNSNPETPQLIQHHTKVKTVTFNNIEEQSNYQQRLSDFGTPIKFQSSTPQLTSMERSANEKNQSTKFTDDDDPITSFQKRLNNSVTLPLKTNSTTIPTTINWR